MVDSHLLEALKSQPNIVSAAITGSVARRSGADAYSDIDLLIVTNDMDAVRDVRLWLPSHWGILIAEFRGQQSAVLRHINPALVTETPLNTRESKHGDQWNRSHTADG